MSTSFRDSQLGRPNYHYVPTDAETDSSARMQASSRASRDNGHALVDGDMERLARALGWFSLGLGFAQIAAPAKVAQLIGVEDDDETITVMRVLGAREIASGLGILTQPKPTPWLWARVGGDAMDLALLRRALSSPRADRNRVAAATAAVAGIAAIDTLCSTRLTAEDSALDQNQASPLQESGEVHAKAAVTINAPLAEVYAFWEDFRNLPRFMGDFASVAVSGDRRSRWSLSAPAGITLDWDVAIIDATPYQRIAWQTAEGTTLNASGEVRFRPAPGGRGTEVVFDATFSPPGGELGKKIAGFFAEALGTKIGSDLRRCKQLVELGEIAHSDDSIIPGPNPAQPPATVPSGIAQSASAA
jgi:uncharacterized membrane protein